MENLFVSCTGDSIDRTIVFVEWSIVASDKYAVAIYIVYLNFNVESVLLLSNLNFDASLFTFVFRIRTLILWKLSLFIFTVFMYANYVLCCLKAYYCAHRFVQFQGFESAS